MIRKAGVMMFLMCAGSAVSAAVGPWDADLSDFSRLSGETGDSARILRAVEAAGKGGVVWFPRGEYAIDAMLVVSNQCSLWMHKSAHLKAVKEMPFILRYFGCMMMKAGRLIWRDNQPLNFTESEMKGLNEELRKQGGEATSAKNDAKLAG